jgi:hypothetical protein
LRRLKRTNLQEGLPEGLDTSKQYEHESELWAELEKVDVSDPRIVLKADGFAVWEEIPGHQHIAAVTELRVTLCA